MGFQGMRGKKDYFTPDFEDSYTREDYEKRAPMGFQGMRGKKSLFEEVNAKLLECARKQFRIGENCLLKLCLCTFTCYLFFTTRLFYFYETSMKFARAGFEGN